MGGAGMRNKIKTKQKAGEVCTAVVSALRKWMCEFNVNVFSYIELDTSVETLSQPPFHSIPIPHKREENLKP